MSKKYEITDIKMPQDIRETHGVFGGELYQIRALKDFECQGWQVSKGDLGGFVESEANLSQEGTCWIANTAVVAGAAAVKNGALVCDNAEVLGAAQILDDAAVGENATVSQCATVCDTAVARGECFISDEAKLCGATVVSGTVSVVDNSVLKDITATGEEYFGLDEEEPSQENVR